MPKMHLKQPLCLVNQDLLILLADPLVKTKKAFKKLKKQEILTIFAKMNQTKHVFNKIWHFEILKI